MTRRGDDEERDEPEEEMMKMRDSAPGEDGVRLKFLLRGGPRVLEKALKVVQFMFKNPADMWEDALKTGIVVPLYKMKGDKDRAAYQ